MSRINHLIEEYGGIAIGTYLVIFAMTFFTFWGLITFGFDLSSLGSWFVGLPEVGTLAIAYAATKLTQPLRIALCIVLIPVVHRYWSRS